MAKQKPELLKYFLPIPRYGIAVLSATIALALALVLQRYNLGSVAFPLFLFAIALTAWFSGDLEVLRKPLVRRDIAEPVARALQMRD
jgi:hypothetical protein